MFHCFSLVVKDFLFKRELQTEPLKLVVRLCVQETREAREVWEALQARLGAYLASQGIAHVVTELAPEPPQVHPRRGKFQQVWSAVQPHLSEDVALSGKGSGK